MTWQDYFKIVRVDHSGPDFADWHDEYQVIDASNNVVGTYKDYVYAKKQAKYRFKKLQKKVESILLK